MYDMILVATDGSDRSRAAVSHGLGLAERYDASVHALYVVDTRALGFDEEGFADDAAILKTLQEGGERATEAVRQRAADRGLEAVTSVVQGTPARRVRQYANDHDIDLIALGTRGRSGIARRMLGSVAESVLRKASQPVLTARSSVAPAVPTYDDLLLPTDGGSHAERVADHAFDIAARYDATVHALSVVDSSLLRSPDLLAALEDESAAALETMQDRGQEVGVDVTTSVWRGTPADCITSYAGERDVDLVVMGSHRNRGLDRFLSHSAAERVVRTAPCPVVTLRRQPAGDESD